MVTRRWPDVVIALAVLGLAALGVWALWGEELGLRHAPTPGAPAPRSAPGPGSGA